MKKVFAITLVAAVAQVVVMHGQTDVQSDVVKADETITKALTSGDRARVFLFFPTINTHIPFVSEMPHGGFGHSGHGKDLSMYGFEDYTRIKHVMANIDS